MSDKERFVYETNNGVAYVKVDKGIQQLWTHHPISQKAVLAMALERWDQNTPAEHSLHNLGIDYQVDDLVRPYDEFPSSNLNKRDIIVAIVLGNIEVFPLDTLKNLGEDSMDCGTWDGIDGVPGYYWDEKEKLGVAAVYPGKPDQLRDVWRGPNLIYRASYWQTGKGKEDDGMEDLFDETDPDDGIIIMKPGRSYLIGISPAVKLQGVQVSMATRSSFARWCLNGMVNSDKVHFNHNGRLTAEAISFTFKPFILNTAWNPWQMYFQYNPVLPEQFQQNGHVGVHTGDSRKSLREAIDAFTPEMMLPGRIHTERQIRLISRELLEP